MRLIKRLLLLITSVLVLGAGVWFAMSNPELISVSLWGFKLPASPVGILLPLSLLCGLVLGLLANLLPWVLLRGRLHYAQTMIKRQERELATLRLRAVKQDRESP